MSKLKKLHKASRKAKVEAAKTPILPETNICLTMIVKDEAPVILRALGSVIHLIDSYAIIDTGSTDGTQEIITDFMETSGIPGRVEERPWTWFADARNQSIELARKVSKELGHNNVYGFWMDADEEIRTNGATKQTLYKDLFGQHGSNISVVNGTQSYLRMQFYSLDVNWKWNGPIHELLVCPEATNINIVSGAFAFIRSDGNSWTSTTLEEKYGKHAEVLEAWVNGDGAGDPRWVFYLAQSYRDTKSTEGYKKALEWYDKRTRMDGGNWEERYYAQIMKGSMMALLEYPKEETIHEYAVAGKFNPYRIEHLIPVIVHYQAIKEMDLAYVYSSYAMRYNGVNPFPKSTLFIDNNVYIWKILELHSYSCYYTNREEERRTTWRRLMKVLETAKIPQGDLNRIKENDQKLR